MLKTNSRVHMLKRGRITGDKEDVINGAAEGSEEVDPGFNGGNLHSGKLAVQRELALATRRPATSS